MTQEEKQLLLIDLCAREPYHPKINIFNDGYEGFQDGEFDSDLWLHHIEAFRLDRIVIRPYLRPMSSMTEDEKKELSKKYNWRFSNNMIQIRYHSDGYWDSETDCPTEEYLNLLDWLNKHYFDYRGLIPMGLALEASEGMYKTE